MITVIIPTYNRPKHLARAIEYWLQSEWPIVIADGSIESFPGQFPGHIDYCHRPGSELSLRISESLRKITTEFVVLCGDDDFIGFNAINACIAFLLENPDYVAAQGAGFSFEQIESTRSIAFPQFAPPSQAHRVDGDTAKLRLAQSMNPYYPPSYAVFRKDALRLALEDAKEFTQLNVWELSTALVPATLGKLAFFPFFYTARQANRNSSGARTLDVIPWAEDPANAEEFNRWRNKIAQRYAETENATLRDGHEAFDQALAAYAQFCLANRKPLARRAVAKVIPIIKALIPDRMIALRRQRIDASRSRSVFPWSDDKSLQDWQRMKSIIQKHGFID